MQQAPNQTEAGAAVREFLILPGYEGSGPAHWQTLWEKEDPAFRRVEQRDWDHPVRDEWVTALEKAVAASGADIVLVAHSLACLLVAHWAQSAPAASLGKIKAAFLVAVADPAGPSFPAAVVGFEPLPERPLPFPALLVASADDPYGPLEFSRRCARAWGTALAEIGAKGHINSGSGLGDWPEGKALLRSLLFG